MPDPLQTVLDETASLRDSLEKSRKRYLHFYLGVIGVAATGFCVVAALNKGGGIAPWPAAGVATLAVAVVGFQVANGFYRRLTKAAFLEKIATALGLSYDKHGLFPVQDVEQHGILPPSDTQKVEDGFTGTINGVPLRFEEVTLNERYKDEDDHWQERPVFWGLVARIKIGKTLEHHTIVMPRNRINTLFRTSFFSHYKPVNLVSPKFEEKFDTIATDQVESRYVLDPAFIERFLEADALTHTKWLAASFRDQEILIAIERFHPLFEIGMLWRRLTDETLAETLAELTTILKMVETLKLNPHTGLGAPSPGGQ